MKICCLMPVYNRFPHYANIVNEAVNSFLIQNYENKELIICNDTPGQFLHFDHQNVRVLNVPERFNSLSEKIRFMIAHSDADAFCRWDDDDINLPWRLSLSAMKMQDKDEWRCERHFFYQTNRIAKITDFPGNSHNMSIWSRKVLNKFGNGYPMHTVVMGDEDQTFNRALVKMNYPLNGELIDKRIIFYIYRLDIVGNHLSKNRNQWRLNGEYPIKTGDFQIEPRWETNYVKMIHEFLKMTGEM